MERMPHKVVKKEGNHEVITLKSSEMFSLSTVPMYHIPESSPCVSPRVDIHFIKSTNVSSLQMKDKTMGIVKSIQS